MKQTDSPSPVVPQSSAMLVEGGISKHPAGRLPGEATSIAEAAYGREATSEIIRIDESTSLDELNAMDLAPGATVLFRRGGTWRGQIRARSGKPGHPITYGAWGEGPKPIIQPSHDRSDPGDWRQEPDGLWWTDSGAGADVGNVLLDGGESGCLFKRGSCAELLRDGDFWCDPATMRVLVRSEKGNPGARWDSVELAEKIHGVDEGGMHDVVFDSLMVRYSAAHGFGGGNTKRITIRGCDIGWIGGGYLYVDKLGNGVRYGNGIEFFAGAEENRVEGCRVWQCWDAGLTNQSNAPGSIQRDILWRDNEVWNCEYSYEFWQQGKDATADDVRLVGNRFRDAGRGWGHAQRWNPNAAHLMFYDTSVPTPGFTVTGNTFARSADWLARVFNEWRGQASFSGNTWESEGEAICRYHGRPRANLRFLYPDHLDQIHCDNAAEIEEQGTGATLFGGTEEEFRRFESAFGFGPDTFRLVPRRGECLVRARRPRVRRRASPPRRDEPPRRVAPRGPWPSAVPRALRRVCEWRLPAPRGRRGARCARSCRRGLPTTCRSRPRR